MSTVEEKTQVGNYFIANYPPFAFWKPEHVPEALEVLRSEPREASPLGLYLHIPFCRRRCKFCYYKVYIDKTGRDVDRYLDALATEIEMYASAPVIGGRRLEFVYFGGGTPSFPSVKQLQRLIQRMDAVFPWREAREITFECEPGTLTEAKVHALRELGVTRISLGVENFNDEILAENGRAHLSAEIYRAWSWIQDCQFPQTNIDLIAGMVGETWDNWRDCVRKAIELAPDSITIYQMELPYNTLYSQVVLKEGKPVPVADWKTKREWVDYAFTELERAGYHINSAYTAVRDPATVQFLYRDALWHGADLIGTGVASFGFIQGVHMQNLHDWEPYLEAVESGEFPLWRALRPTRRQLMIREFILQLKLGRVSRRYFVDKFGIDPCAEFEEVLRGYEDAGWMETDGDEIRVTRRGLLRVDSLLPAFFEPEHRGPRYA